MAELCCSATLRLTHSRLLREELSVVSMVMLVTVVYINPFVSYTTCASEVCDETELGVTTVWRCLPDCRSDSVLGVIIMYGKGIRTLAPFCFGKVLQQEHGSELNPVKL